MSLERALQILAKCEALTADARALVQSLSPTGPTPAPPVSTSPVLVFQELWEPRNAQNGVFGTVTSMPLVFTPDGFDPEQVFVANNITAKWGTLAGMDGSSSLPKITGTSSPGHWEVVDNVLRFHGRYVKTAVGHVTDGFALISQATFDRTKRIVAEAQMLMTAGNAGAFLELCLVAGEGDYRGLAYRRNAESDTINGVAPLREAPLKARGVPGWDVFRLEYNPQVGWKYMVNGAVLAEEPISGPGVPLTANPHLGLYFTGAGPGSWVEGAVGSINVWVG